MHKDVMFIFFSFTLIHPSNAPSTCLSVHPRTILAPPTERTIHLSVHLSPHHPQNAPSSICPSIHPSIPAPSISTNVSSSKTHVLTIRQVESIGIVKNMDCIFFEKKKWQSPKKKIFLDTQNLYFSKFEICKNWSKMCSGHTTRGVDFRGQKYRFIFVANPSTKKKKVGSGHV